jgi:hypothetical protein
MKYSYIKPRHKTVLSSELKLLLTFFSITAFMLVSTYLFLVYKDYSFQKDKETIIAKRYDINITINQMQEQIDYINKEISLSNEIFTQNNVLKESITNLFDLVPHRITLSEASLLKNGLILHGITPNKDVYNFMLQAPLRSIFHKTYSSFYPLDNGWIRFVSTNYVEEKEEFKDKVDDED